MRRTGILFLAVLFLVQSFLFSTAARAESEIPKIGYVDISFVFDSYNKTKDQDALLSEKSKGKQAERKGMVGKIRNMKNELEVLSDKQREKKQEQIDEEIVKLQGFDRKTKRELQKDRDDMVREILNEIDVVIKEYAKKHSHNLILNKRVLIYAQKKYDITQDILNILNSRYKKK